LLVLTRQASASFKNWLVNPSICLLADWAKEQRFCIRVRPQEVIAQHLSMKSLKRQFFIPRQDVVVLVCQLQKSWLNLEAQRKTFVMTITALHQACRAIFNLERFGGAASFGDNKQSTEKKNLS